MEKKVPNFCLQCRSRECEDTELGTFDICKYGIAFFNKESGIQRKQPSIPLTNISRNLRHEINPILQIIIEQLSKQNPYLSKNEIDTSEPLSVALGATVIIDHFIQMITGVHEFHFSDKSKSIKSRELNLKNSVQNLFNIYSILQESGRSKNLELINEVDKNIRIYNCSEFLNYMLSVLIDNAHKYSTSETEVIISTEKGVDGRVNLEIINISEPIPEEVNVFELGVKKDDETKGFGYGLYWAKTLEFHYNHLNDLHDGKELQIVHKSYPFASTELRYQKFLIKNIIASYEE